MNFHIDFSPPDISEEEINSVVKTLRSGWITTGPQTKLLEQSIANYCNTNRAVCLNSATACMELCLRLFGIGPGDEVITSVYTYSATCSVICHVGAVPVLIDTGEDSFELNYDALEKAITARTKAIIPIDVGGVMCDYKRILDIVERKRSIFQPNGDMQSALGRVLVMADAAHSFGAKRDGLVSGEAADFSCFSFHAVKNLTTAEGGALTWKPLTGINDAEIYSQFMLFSLHGQSKDALEKAKIGSWEYDIKFPGYKCNMTDIMAAIGFVQLKRFPQLLQRRRQIIESYDEAFAGINVTMLKHFTDSYESSGHIYCLRLNGKNESYRNLFIEKMVQKGICTNVHYKPLPMHTAYKNLGFKIGDFPNAFNVYKNEVTIPLHTLLTEPEINHIINSVTELT